MATNKKFFSSLVLTIWCFPWFLLELFSLADNYGREDSAPGSQLVVCGSIGVLSD